MRFPTPPAAAATRTFLVLAALAWTQVWCSCPQGWADARGNCVACWPQFTGPTCSTPCTCLLGTCDNGTTASGHCTGACNKPNVTGTDCNSCVSGTYGPVCQYACPNCGSHGRCSDGMSGTGRCTCAAGWYGRLCSAQKRSTTKTRTNFVATSSTPKPTTTTVPSNTSRAPGNASTTNSSTTAIPVGTTTVAPIAAPCPQSYVIAVSLIFLTQLNASVISAAVANTVGIKVGLVSTWAPVGTAVGANYAVLAAFTTSVNTTSASPSVQALYLQLLSALTYNVANPVALLGLVSFTATCQTATTVAPINVNTSVPLAPPSSDGGGGATIPVYGIVLISIGIVAVIGVGAFAVWRVYTRRLKQKEADNKAADLRIKRQREFEMTRLAGEATALDMDPQLAAVAGGDTLATQRRGVKFGDIAAPLPTAPLAADEEFVVAPRSSGKDVVPVNDAVPFDDDDFVDPNDVDFDDLGASALGKQHFYDAQGAYSPSGTDGMVTPVDRLTDDQTSARVDAPPPPPLAPAAAPAGVVTPAYHAARIDLSDDDME